MNGGWGVEVSKTLFYGIPLQSKEKVKNRSCAPESGGV